MIMKRFFVRNLFVLLLSVISVLTMMSLVLMKGSLTLLLVILIVCVLAYVTKRLTRFDKDGKLMPTINFDQHCIECRRTGKILYQFTLPEWDSLSLDEKYDMTRLFTLA
jgi:Ca2+/Na+ antiporter